MRQMNPFSQMMQNGNYEALMADQANQNFDASQAAFLQQNQPQNPANITHMSHKVEFTVSLTRLFWMH